MADQPTKKRVVKNPETFRERAIKAAEEGDQPRRTSRIKTASGKAAAPIGSAATKVGQVKPVRIAGKFLFPRYIRDSLQELKLVQWPSWEQSRRLTVAVLIFAIIFGVTIAGVDYVLDKLFKILLLGK